MRIRMSSRRLQGFAAATIGASVEIWRRTRDGDGDCDESPDHESRSDAISPSSASPLKHPMGHFFTPNGVWCSSFSSAQPHIGPSSILATSSLKQDEYDDYPNMKFNRSLLAKYLTRELWQELRDKKTKNGVTLDYCIQSGVSLPLAYDARTGIIAGDADCYDVFGPLLVKIIRDHHNFGEDSYPNVSDEVQTKASIILRRHHTDIDPRGITSHEPDPDGDYILSTRLRLCRNISGFSFPSYMSRSERRSVERLFQASLKYLEPGKYLPIFSMTNEDIQDLVQRHILFDSPDEWAIAAGLARDWPDARGIYLNVADIDETPDLMVHCNAEDHLSIICIRKDGNIRRIFMSVAKCLRNIEASLLESGHEFVRHEQLGYLTSCPTNIGTALRASVHVKLIQLGRRPGFKEMVKRMRLDARGKHGETDKRYSGIFDISNAVRIGKSEVELINVMIHGVGKLIELEKALERGEEVDCSKLFLDTKDE